MRWRQNLRWFCSLTDLHGFGYLVRNRHWLETGFWAVAVTVSVSMAMANCIRWELTCIDKGYRKREAGSLSYNGFFTWRWYMTIQLQETFMELRLSRSFAEFSRSPVFFNVDTLHLDPSEVPFPAVTFCPVQVLDQLNALASAINQVRLKVTLRFERPPLSKMGIGLMFFGNFQDRPPLPEYLDHSLIRGLSWNPR